jgi:hypothetical protein
MFLARLFFISCLDFNWDFPARQSCSGGDFVWDFHQSLAELWSTAFSLAFGCSHIKNQLVLLNA